MPTKPVTFVADITNLPKVLVEHFIKLERWCVWKWEVRSRPDGTEKWTKTPYQARFPNQFAKTNDASTWGKYDDAIAAVGNGTADGIGFMLKDSDFGAVDVDHVRDPGNGDVLGWAMRLIEEADQLSLYREVTVSGCGLRFIGLAPGGSKLHQKFTFNRNSGAGIELYRNCERYITISGLQQGKCKQLGSIDGYLDELVKRFNPQPPPQAYNFNFNQSSSQAPNDYYRDLIENSTPAGGRSEKFQEVVWHLAASGWTIDQIVDELAKYPNGIGEKYAGRLAIEVARSFTKWQARRRAAVTGSPGVAPPNTPWPQIFVRASELPRVINEAEDALLLLGRDIYQRGGQVVRPVLSQSLKASDNRATEAWQLIGVTRPHLVEVLCCAAQFQKYDKRAKKFVAVDAPDKVAETYLNRRGSWKLPRLAGVTNTPFMRADGSICETPGYDAASYLLFKPENQIYPPVPTHPSQGDAIRSLEKLRELIVTFPFVGKADRAAGLAGFLTVLDRRLLMTAPLFGFTSPTAGTGKSLLVDLISILAIGRLMPVSSQGRNEEEFEKRLAAHLLAGDACISIDNCMYTLTGALLCQALTQPEVNVRVLGYSRNVTTLANATIFATGNNLVAGDDLTRRALLCSLDAGVERPELRTFPTNAVEQAYDHRGELVVAVLTILRAWYLAYEAGERLRGVAPLGGFDDWSRRVREALIWVGETDPCLTMEKARENDPAREHLTIVMEQWKVNLGTTDVYTVQDVIGRAVNVPSFYTALLNVATSKSGGVVSNDRLGRWLVRVQGKIVGGLKFEKAGVSYGYSTWKLGQ
jgi:hypothetical protein